MIIDPYKFNVVGPDYAWSQMYGVVSFTDSNRTFNFSGGTSFAYARTGAAIYGGRVYCEMANTVKQQNANQGLGITYDVGNALTVYYNGPDVYFSQDGGCSLSNNGGIYIEGSSANEGLNWKYGPGDRLGFAVDTVGLKMWLSKNGVWLQGDPSTGTNPPITFLSGKTWYFYAGVYLCFGASGPIISETIYPSSPLFLYTPPAGFVPYQPSDITNPTPDSRLKLDVPFPSGLPADTSVNPASITVSSDATFSSTDGLIVYNNSASTPKNCSTTYTASKLSRAIGDSIVIELYVKWAALEPTSDNHLFAFNSNQGSHILSFSNGQISWTFNGTTVTTTQTIAQNTRGKINLRIDATTQTGRLWVNDTSTSATMTVANAAYTSGISAVIGSTLVYSSSYFVDDVKIWIGTI